MEWENIAAVIAVCLAAYVLNEKFSTVIKRIERLEQSLSFLHENADVNSFDSQNIHERLKKLENEVFVKRDVQH